LLDYSTGDWLHLLSSQNFSTDVLEASYTVGDITLTAAASAGPYTVAAGDLIAVFAASGNRYINRTGGTIPSGGSVTLSFGSEFPGSKYNDPSSSGSISLVTSLPGVTLTNPAGNFSDVAHVGAGTGTLSLAFTGSPPPAPHQFTVRIDTTGATVGLASWSYSIDGGVYTSAGFATTVTNAGGTSVNITLVNGAALTTSFVADDTYLFYSPGTWIDSQGSDQESDENLQQRCRDRWSTLSPIPVNNFYDMLVRTTPTVGSQVTSVIVLPDAIENNKVNIIVVGPEGILPPATIATIQDYVNPRVPITEKAFVTSPGEQFIQLTATITVAASQLAAATNAITTAMYTYVYETPINGTLRLAAITDRIMNVPGTVDVTGLQINGVAANKVLGNPSVFVVARPDPSFLLFTFVTV
jgi:hypothetical protein